ncbi:hypothetical protein HYX13_04715 [Candidatus Woesearchaeota archaeon]|nr:hypothetical protein [Candidatus Woesearchaeota archaeon]
MGIFTGLGTWIGTGLLINAIGTGRFSAFNFFGSLAVGIAAGVVSGVIYDGLHCEKVKKLQQEALEQKKFPHEYIKSGIYGVLDAFPFTQDFSQVEVEKDVQEKQDLERRRQIAGYQEKQRG